MGTSASNRRRWGWAALLGALAVLLLVALLWPRGTPPSPAPEAQQSSRASTPADAVVRAPPSTAAAQPAAVTAAEPSSSNAPDAPPPEAIPSQPPDAPPVELPPTTQALTEEFFPGTTDWESVPVDDSHEHQLRILPTRYNVVAPMPIAVQLEMIDRKGQRQPLPNPRVRVRTLDNDARPWIDVPVRDDGTGADAKAGDLLYTATLQPNAEQKKQLLGRVFIEGSVDVPGVGTRVIPSALIYTVGPRAKFTGRWRDFVRDGNLALEAELDVEEPGLFTLMAQVFGPHLEPIAWVKQTDTLGSGRRTLTLEVFGKVLHDAGIDGPYHVRQVLLSRDYENSADYDPGVTVEEAHQTRPYRASEFSGAAYVPPPRVVREVTADSPSQQDKPPPLRTRDTTPASQAPPPPATPANGAPGQATDLQHAP